MLSLNSFSFKLSWQTLANSQGLNAIQRTMDQLCPQSLYLKPVYFAQEFVKTLWKSSQLGKSVIFTFIYSY